MQIQLTAKGKKMEHHFQRYSDDQVKNLDLIKCLRRFLRRAESLPETEISGQREAQQPPIFGVILSFDPLVITDETFQHSLKLTGFTKIKYRNEELQESSYCIELIDWKWRLFLDKWSSENQKLEDLVEACCNSFRIWKETGNFIDIDVVPPSIFDHPDIKHQIFALAQDWSSSILKERPLELENCSHIFNDSIKRKKLKHSSLNQKNSITEKDRSRESFETRESGTSSLQKENLPVDKTRSMAGDNRDHRMYLFKKSCVLRGHPVLIKIKERSRSSSPSRGHFSKSSEVISVISDSES